MLRAYRSVLVPLAIFAMLAALVGRTSDEVFRRMAADRFEVRYIPNSGPLKLLSPGAQLTVANHYWLLAVQYIGEQAARGEKYARLPALAELITDLDPRHGYAYQTAGIVLSSAGRIDESDAILKKGYERGPRWWSYPFYLAFNAFFYRGDFAAAATWAELAARTPGASTNISHLALAMKVRSGSPDDAVRFLEEMRAISHDERTSEALEEQYRLALLARDFARLDAAVERFRAERGRPPSHLRELVEAGLVPEIPRDPYGGTYVWRDGKVHSTAKDFRFSPPPKVAPGRMNQRVAPASPSPASKEHP